MLFVFMLGLTSTLFGQAKTESFVRKYKYVTISNYNENTKKYDDVKQRLQDVTIFFNVDNSSDIKIVVAGDKTMLYGVSMTNDDTYESDGFQSFEAFFEDGEETMGALGKNWFLLKVGNQLVTYKRFKD